MVSTFSKSCFATRKVPSTSFSATTFNIAAHLTRQAKEITDLLENTNFFNVGKNTDKAVEHLQRFFPAMENFQTQIPSLQKQTENLFRQVKRGQLNCSGRER